MRRLLAFAALVLAWAAASGATLDLSVAEREWIAGHGTVHVGVVQGAEPFYSLGEADQQARGFAIDLLDIAAERAGLRLQYRRAASIPELARQFRNGEVDMVPTAARTTSRERLLSFPGSLLTARLVFVSRRDTGDLSAAQNFAGRTIGVVEGSAPGEIVQTHVPGAKFIHFGSTTELALAVSQGKADLGAAWQHEAVYAIEANLLGNLRVHRVHEVEGSYYGPAVSARLPYLHSIMAKALESLSPAERAAAARRWLPSGADTLWAPETVTLTDAERAWLQRDGEVRLGYDGAFAPFTQSTRLGGFDGYGAEVLRLMAGKTGLRIVGQSAGTFDEAYRRAQAGELNLIVGMARTASRRDGFDFIGPFASAPTALVMRSDDPRLWRDPGEINGGRLGALKAHFLLPELRSRRPALAIQEFDSNDGVLQALADGRIDAAMGNGSVLGRLLQERYLGRLRVTGVVPDGDSELFFAVPKGHPELVRVLQKGFDALTPGETAALERHWLTVSVQPGLSVADVLRWLVPIALALLAVVATLVVANGRLRRAAASEAQARSAAEASNAARGRFLAYLSHELRGTVGGIGSGMKLLLASDDPTMRRRLAEAARASCDSLQVLLEATLASERTMMTGITPVLAPLDLQDWWRGSIAPLALAAQAKGLGFVEQGPPEIVRVRADGARLAQVLGNLAGNAIKFTPSGDVRVLAAWDGHGLTLTVGDTGPGIDPSERDRLFEPYAQGTAGRQAAVGAGLGLAITRQIVLAMGGTIEVEAGAPAGAVFRVWIPLEKA